MAGIGGRRQSCRRRQQQSVPDARICASTTRPPPLVRRWQACHEYLSTRRPRAPLVAPSPGNNDLVIALYGSTHDLENLYYCTTLTGDIFFSRYPSVALWPVIQKTQPILGYPTGYSQPHTPNKPSQKMAAWCGHHRGADIITGNLCPIPAHDRDPRIDAAVADDWCWGAESESAAIAGDGRCSTQGAAEY